MRPCDMVRCEDFPCSDVRLAGYVVPDVEVDPERISAVLISEAAPDSPGDSYYAEGDPLFARTTVQAFRDAGSDVSSIRDILSAGIYLTTAVKCAKSSYSISTETVKTCARLLQMEIDLFLRAKVFLLMGDVAIKAFNAVAQRAGEKRVIPAGSTYKIRGEDFRFRGARIFPSYLQAGPSFFIEKSKRTMIAEDIAAALRLLRA